MTKFNTQYKSKQNHRIHWTHQYRAELTTYLRHAFLRFALRFDYSQNELVAIQLWIDLFIIGMILFQLLSTEYC